MYCAAHEAQEDPHPIINYIVISYSAERVMVQHSPLLIHLLHFSQALVCLPNQTKHLGGFGGCCRGLKGQYSKEQLLSATLLSWLHSSVLAEGVSRGFPGRGASRMLGEAGIRQH